MQMRLAQADFDTAGHLQDGAHLSNITIPYYGHSEPPRDRDLVLLNNP